MQIKRIEKHEYSLFFNLGLSKGSIFCSEKWLNSVANDNNLLIFGIFDNQNKLIGGFFLYKEKKWGLNFYKNPPFTASIGLFCENKAKNPAKKHSFDKKVANLLAQFFNKLDYHLLKLQLPVTYTDMQPFIWQKFKVIPSYTYLIDLQQNKDSIYAAFSPERRNDIKRAQKDNILIEESKNAKEILPLIQNTFSRKNLTINRQSMSNIVENFVDSDNALAILAYHNEQAISATFCVFDNGTMYYILGGYTQNNKHAGAGASAIWQAIQTAQAKGLKYFDFEGSMLPEVEQFFRGFGGTLTPTYTINKAILPLEIALKFVKRAYF